MPAWSQAIVEDGRLETLVKGKVTLVVFWVFEYLIYKMTVLGTSWPILALQ